MIENTVGIKTLLAGTTDADFGYITDEPLELSRKRVAYSLLRLVSYGMAFSSPANLNSRAFTLICAG